MKIALIMQSFVLFGVYLTAEGAELQAQVQKQYTTLTAPATVRSAPGANICTRTRVAENLGCACFLEHSLPSFTDPDLSILCMAIFDEEPKDLDFLCTRFTRDGEVNLRTVVDELQHIRWECDIKKLFTDDADSLDTIDRNEVSDEELFDILGLERTYNAKGELVIPETARGFFSKIRRSIKKVTKSVVDFVKKPIEKVVDVAKTIIKNPVKAVVDFGRNIVHEARKVINDPGDAIFKLVKNVIPLPSFIEDPLLKVVDRVIGGAVCAIGDVIGAKRLVVPAGNAKIVGVPLKNMSQTDWTSTDAWGGAAPEKGGAHVRIGAAVRTVVFKGKET